MIRQFPWALRFLWWDFNFRKQLGQEYLLTFHFHQRVLYSSLSVSRLLHCISMLFVFIHWAYSNMRWLSAHFQWIRRLPDWWASIFCFCSQILRYCPEELTLLHQQKENRLKCCFQAAVFEELVLMPDYYDDDSSKLIYYVFWIIEINFWKISTRWFDTFIDRSFL